MRSDGNGGYIIQKGTFAMIMVVIALLSCIGTVIAYGVYLRTDVNYLKNAFEDQVIINSNIQQHETAIIINQEKILNMEDDLKIIKSDIKELLAK